VIVLLQPLLRPAVSAPPVQSIAVLPIKNLTGDPSKQYLADGLTEVIVAHLARLPGLQVASSATMATLQGSRDDEKALAEKLGVRLLLAGSVVQADDRIALSVKLTEPREGRTIWGSELERQTSNILGARSEIARLIAARLSLDVPDALRAAASRQFKAEAQDAFLRGLVESSSGSNARVLHAIDLLSRAVELEPNWADPLAQLALTQQMAIEFGDPAQRQGRAEIAKANALHAIEMDPAISASYSALASVQAYHDWDLPGAEATLRQGLSAVPRDAAAHGRLAMVLAAAGRLTEAVSEAELARDQEPLVPERHTNLGMVRYYARDFVGGLTEMDRALAIAPDYALGYHGRGRVLAALGRYDEAIDSLRKALAISDNAGWWATLGVIYAKAGRTSDVNSVLQRLRAFELKGIFVSVDQYAYIAAHQGRFDDAFRLIETAIDRRMTNVLWLAVDPRADALRNDPRFDRLVARMGLVSR
jgi:TolB-like protein/Flp pilus assembly protein TadD